MAQSEDDAEYIQRQIDAIESRDTSTGAQRKTLEELTQQAAAWLLSITARHLRDQGAARNPDGTYNGPALVQWFVARTVDQQRKRWDNDGDRIVSARERKATAAAVKMEVAASLAAGEVIDRADVRRDIALAHSRFANRLMGLGTTVSTLCPAELKATVKTQVESVVRLALKELAAEFEDESE